MVEKEETINVNIDMSGMNKTLAKIEIRLDNIEKILEGGKKK